MRLLAITAICCAVAALAGSMARVQIVGAFDWLNKPGCTQSYDETQCLLELQLKERLRKGPIVIDLPAEDLKILQRGLPLE